MSTIEPQTMHTRHLPLLLAVVAVCQCFAGCQSENPLSDPQKSKADERLVGVWRDRSGDADSYYHVGCAGDKFPACMMRVVLVVHAKKGLVQPPGEFLIFPTVLRDKTYLNVARGKNDALISNLLKEHGYAVEAVGDGYTFYKYVFDGDKLLVYGIDEKAQQKAIESGKVKGTVTRSEKTVNCKLSDTSEDLARFVKEAGDDLFSTKVMQLERVK